MSDFRVFGFQTTRNDVLINVDFVREAIAVRSPDNRDIADETTFIMNDGSKIDLCDYFDGVAARLKHGDDSPEAKKVFAGFARDKQKLKKTTGWVAF